MKLLVGLIVIATFLGQYLFSKSKSLYGYTSAIYFELEKNVNIKKKYKENFKLTIKNNLKEKLLEENSRFSHCCPKFCINSKYFFLIS